ncbi:MAG: hypothetical protein JST80_08625 [Bdellovibrionales bacterium]|nr:hypothetical protein [Bdellovibrionales bacterium]
MKSKALKIFQIYYLESQKNTLDPAFTPFDNTSNPHPELYETYILEKIFNQLDHYSEDLIGTVSHKFGIKMKVPGSTWLDDIAANPGADLYICDPFPQDGYFFYNIWGRAEKSHPGIIPFAQDVLDAVGVKVDIKNFPRKIALHCNCNFWVGTKEFWRTYIPVVSKAKEYVLQSPKRDEFLLRHSGPDGDFVFYPYIIERLLTSYLVTNSNLNVHKFVPSKPDIEYSITTMQLEVMKQLVPGWSAIEHELAQKPIKEAISYQKDVVRDAVVRSNLILGRDPQDWTLF